MKERMILGVLLLPIAAFGTTSTTQAQSLSGDEVARRTIVHRLTVKDVPVDAFWSIIIYNAEGHFQKNAFDAYALNNITAKKEVDGAVTVQFGGCDGKIPNCLPTVPGWNYMVRLYRPRAEILNGAWKFPEVVAVN